MPPHIAVAAVTHCRDCSTPLLPTNGTGRCAECTLVLRNEQLDEPALRERRYELMRLAAVTARTAAHIEFMAEINDNRTDYR